MSNKEEIVNYITTNINEFFESKNNKFTKKEFSDFISKIAKDSYDTHYNKKGSKRTSKKLNNDSEEKIKKPLSEYQKFMKEQMIILKEKNDGKKPNDLMKEIGVLWKAKKEEGNEKK